MSVAGEFSIFYCNYLWFFFAAFWAVMAFRGARAEATESFVSRLSHVLPVVAAFTLLMASSLNDTPGLGETIWPPIDQVGRIGVGVTLAGLLFAIWARIHLGRY